MFNPENVSPPSFDPKPFLIYIRHRDKLRDVAWRPDAFVGFSRGLRASGLLAVLPAEDLKSLLYLLTFATPNGHVSVGTRQLAEAFHLSQAKTHRRMARLMQTQWAQKPLVHYRRFESGWDAFMPQTGLFSVEEEQSAPSESQSAPAHPAVSRETIIAHSRQTYARPRAEVEAMVASQLRPISPSVSPSPSQPLNTPESVPAEFSTEQRQIMEQLQSFGVNIEQALSLLARFDVPRIQRQIAWLPYRHVKNPVGFLIAAIEHDYEAPRGLPQDDVADAPRGQPAPDDSVSANPAP